ncbi:YcxB family protein [Fluviicola chungangensis]|uniref:YcxB family protein n=1 Tax=Fluviicola chungangensis TaxID=2597671 RepID=A0A556N7D6_9FLAO|nr:YcxB family protein [Fluviicola chungangensis]TSJ48031.1 YcxB family protein [Fluviicola chungangensis]
MQIKTTLTQSQFAKLTGILLLKRLQVLFLILAVLGLIIGALIAIFFFHNKDAYMLVFVAVVFLGLFAFSIFNNAKRHYQNNPRIRQETTYDFSDKGVLIAKEGFSSTIKWNEIIRIRKKAGLILIWQNKLVANVISAKDVTPQQLDEIKSLIRKKNVPSNF